HRTRLPRADRRPSRGARSIAGRLRRCAGPLVGGGATSASGGDPMTTTPLRRVTSAVILGVGLLHATATLARAASAGEISSASRRALNDLYKRTPAAKTLAEKARGILVFPSIVKGGFIFGGEFGEGALFKGGKTSGYYNTTGVSWGFQAGLQKYGYALFFMTDSALTYLDKSEGFELGTGPSLVVVDE